MSVVPQALGNLLVSPFQEVLGGVEPGEDSIGIFVGFLCLLC